MLGRDGVSKAVQQRSSCRTTQACKTVRNSQQPKAKTKGKAKAKASATGKSATRSKQWCRQVRPDSQNKVEATLQHRPANEDALPPAATENEAAERVECPKNVDALTAASSRKRRSAKHFAKH